MDTARDKTRQRLSPEARLAQLLDAALASYARMGVERAGHGDVAKIAGVSTPTVFNYFPTRDALTESVLNAVQSHIRDVFQPSAEDDFKTASRQEHLLALAQRFNALSINQPDVIKVLLNWSVCFGETIRPGYLAFQDELLDQIHLTLTQTAPAGGPGERAEARIIYGAATTLALMQLDHSPTETIAKFIERVVLAVNNSPSANL